MCDPITNSSHKVATYSKQGVPGPGLEDLKKDSVPTLQQDTCRKQKIRSENALITLERLQSSRDDLKTKETKSTDKAEQYSEAKDHYQMAVTKGVKHANTRERRKFRSSVARRTWTQSIAKVSVAKFEHDYAATTQTNTDPKYPRTETARAALWCGWRTTHVDESGRDADVKQSPEHSLASRLIREYSHAWRHPTLSPEHRSFGRMKRHTANTLRRELDKMAQFLVRLLVME